MVALIFAMLIGLVLAVGSAFYLFAIGMSDSPREGHSGRGCVFALVGAALFLVSLIAIIARLF